MPEDKTFHCQFGCFFIISLSLLFKLLFLDTYSRSCWGVPARILLLDGGPHFSRCWGLIVEFFPRNCPQIKGAAYINDMPLLGGNLRSGTGSCKSTKVWSSCLKSWDISEWPSQLQSSLWADRKLVLWLLLGSASSLPILLPLLASGDAPKSTSQRRTCMQISTSESVPGKLTYRS